MRYPTRRHALLLGLLAIILIPAGCTKHGNVTVTGTLLRGGKPIPLSKTGVLQITLQPDVPPDVQYTTYVGRGDATGKFEILEVPPGKYKIGIEVLDPTPQDDQLRGTMTASLSKIIREIDGKAPLTIDLSKPGS